MWNTGWKKIYNLRAFTLIYYFYFSDLEGCANWRNRCEHCFRKKGFYFFLSYLVLSDICICEWVNSIESNELKVMHGALTRKHLFPPLQFLFLWMCVSYFQRNQCCEHLTQFWFKFKKLSEESWKSDSDNFRIEPGEQKGRRRK